VIASVGSQDPAQSRSGNVWDNAAMESFFSSLKTERTARKMHRSRDEAKADVFELDKKPAVIVPQPDPALNLTPQYDQLTSERRILCLKPAL
jgi:transposase InsO family protein